MPRLHSNPVKPPALRIGDRIGIVAPAGAVIEADLAAGVQALRALGYEPVMGESVLARDGYFAGTAEQRARDFIDMLERDDIRAIVCARGGYGCNYLLPVLDRVNLRSRPKIVVGYSDVTALLTRFVDRGLVGFHGPMVAKDFARDSLELSSWNAVLGGKELTLELSPECGVKALAPGSADGVLYGGCLSLLVASLGTPYEIQTQGTVLFIEDVNAWPYQIDRMLMQLKFAGKFDGVRALVFGEMLDCGTKDSAPGVRETIMRVVGNLGVPVAFGVPSGHVSSRNVTLPFGVKSHAEFSEGSVRICCEPATSL